MDDFQIDSLEVRIPQSYKLRKELARKLGIKGRSKMTSEQLGIALWEELYNGDECEPPNNFSEVLQAIHLEPSGIAQVLFNVQCAVGIDGLIEMQLYLFAMQFLNKESFQSSVEPIYRDRLSYLISAFRAISDHLQKSAPDIDAAFQQEHALNVAKDKLERLFKRP